MTLIKLLLTAPIVLSGTVLMGQAATGVGPADLLKPLKDSWPTYSGDYSGKRYSALDQINQSNVKNLTLAWMSRVTPGPEQGGRGRRGARGARPPRARRGPRRGRRDK